MGSLSIKNKALRCQKCFMLKKITIEPNYPQSEVCCECVCGVNRQPILSFSKELLKEEHYKIKCHFCNKEPKQASYCTGCRRLYCPTCIKSHDTNINTKTPHDVIDSFKYDFYCSRHREVLLSAYCMTCSLNICQNCINEKLHKSHRFVKYTKLILKDRDEDFLKINLKVNMDKVDANTKRCDKILALLTDEGKKKELKEVCDITVQENKSIINIITYFYKIYSEVKHKNYAIIFNVSENIKFSPQLLPSDENASVEQKYSDFLEFLKREYVIFKRFNAPKPRSYTTVKNNSNMINQIDNKKENENKAPNQKDERTNTVTNKNHNTNTNSNTNMFSLFGVEKQKENNTDKPKENPNNIEEDNHESNTLIIEEDKKDTGEEKQENNIQENNIIENNENKNDEIAKKEEDNKENKVDNDNQKEENIINDNKEKEENSVEGKKEDNKIIDSNGSENKNENENEIILENKNKEEEKEEKQNENINNDQQNKNSEINTVDNNDKKEEEKIDMQQPPNPEESMLNKEEKNKKEENNLESNEKEKKQEQEIQNIPTIEKNQDNAQKLEENKISEKKNEENAEVNKEENKIKDEQKDNKENESKENKNEINEQKDNKENEIKNKENHEEKKVEEKEKGKEKEKEKEEDNSSKSDNQSKSSDSDSDSDSEEKKEEKKDNEKKDENKKEEEKKPTNNFIEKQKSLLKKLSQPIPEISHLLGITQPNSQTPEGEKPKEENAPTNKVSKEKDDSEVKLNRIKRALERRKRLENPPATKRLSQPNILHNPKFAQLIQQMGGKLPGMPPIQNKESKEEEVKIEVVKENPNEIIMNKPMRSKSSTKKKPTKIVFIDGVEVVQEVSDEDEKSEDDNKKENKEDKEKENK